MSHFPLVTRKSFFDVLWIVHFANDSKQWKIYFSISPSDSIKVCCSSFKLSTESKFLFSLVHFVSALKNRVPHKQSRNLYTASNLGGKIVEKFDDNVFQKDRVKFKYVGFSFRRRRRMRTIRTRQITQYERKTLKSTTFAVSILYL